MIWRIMERHAAQRGSLTTGAAPRFEWRPSPHYQNFPTAAAARRALMVSLMPELKGHTDEQIRQHYDPYQRNVGHHKVEQVRQEPSR
jgi:hypothetical protein